MNSKKSKALELAAESTIIELTPQAIVSVNEFTKEIFHTRGGRIGSGMGSVIEALWGFHLNNALSTLDVSYELGWIYGHEYNDFACIKKAEEWDPATKAGELFRIEVKSMVASADESKAHFDRLVHEFDLYELLAVFIWDWVPVTGESRNVYPSIIAYFVGPALPIAQMRDRLHIARGGSFVKSGSCPDGCAADCKHVGEPLNASGLRERRSGPDTAKKGKVSYAANFGGMLRMLGTRGPVARAVLQQACNEDVVCKKFVDFMGAQFGRVLKAMKSES